MPTQCRGPLARPRARSSRYLHHRTPLLQARLRPRCLVRS